MKLSHPAKLIPLVVTVLTRTLHAYSLANWEALRLAALSWAIVLLGLGFSQAMPALTLILVARRVLPTDYAQYLSSYTLLSLLIVLPSYGMDTWLLTRGNAGILNGKSVWSGALKSRVRLLVLWTGCVILLGIFLPQDTFPLQVMLPTTLGLAFDSLSLLSFSSLRTLGRHGQVTLLQSVSSFALLGITLALPLEPGQIMLFAIVRSVLSALTAAVAVTIAGKLLTSQAAPIPLRDILRAVHPFMLADLAVSIYMRADLTLVSLIIGITGASIFGPAINLINMTFLVPNALTLFILPILSKSFAESRARFVRLGVAQLVAQSVTGAVISLGIFWLAPIAIPLLFGSAYAPSVAVLEILSPIPFLKSLNFALGSLLTSGGHQVQRTSAQVLCAIFNVIATLVCIIPFGVSGVAVVHTLSELFLFLGYSLALFHWWDRQWQTKS